MPTSLYLMPTQRCNCRCTYCYLPAQEKRKTGEEAFFTQVLDQFIADMARRPTAAITPQLRFIGGEPYLKADWVLRLSRRFLEAMPESMVTINSNGTLIDQVDLSWFAERPQQLVHVLSLDGPPHIHDLRRPFANGEGSFEAVVSGARYLLERGFSVYFNMVLDQQSVTGMDELMAFISGELQMGSISVSLLDSRDRSLSSDQKLTLLEAAYDCATRHGLRLGGHHRLLLGYHIPELKCCAGLKSILVTSDRKLVGCQRFVGRCPRSPIEPGAVDFLTVRDHDHLEACCYTAELRRLGERLYHLYQDRYPEYAQVHDLDRALFGVI